jgi:hypothetical protein
MLAHTLKNILDLVPDALPMVKQASVDKDLPMDGRDSILASALQLQYFEKVAFQPVDVFEMEKIAQAVDMYGLSEEVRQISDKMVKAAHARKVEADLNSVENYLLKVSSFEGTLGNMDIKERSSTATELYKEAKEKGLEPSEDVILYSGNAYLSKEAAVKSLSVRYHKTKNNDFVKIASAIGKTPDDKLNSEVLTSLADTISLMDKSAGLHFGGHNFYKEAFFTKEAAFKGSISINLAGKQVPYESFERLGKARISQYIGDDVAKEMDAGPANFKTVVETLPLDLQRVMAGMIKNV